MATFYTNDKKEDFFTPFGPGMAKLKLSDSYVNRMNDIINKQERHLKDFSDNLVS
jgi:hypothetical protein